MDREAVQASARSSLTQTPVAAVVEDYIGRLAGKDRTRTAARARWWGERFDLKPVGETTRQDIRAGLADLLSTPALARRTNGNVVILSRLRSPATVNRHPAALSSVLNFACAYRDFGDNVARRLPSQREVGRRDRILSSAELRALLDACRRSSWPRIHRLVLLAATTGGRLGEALELRWEDVDLGSGVVVFRDTKNRPKDPTPAIGTATELFETCGKTILPERGKEIAGTPDIPALTKATLRELKLVPEGGFRTRRAARASSSAC